MNKGGKCLERKGITVLSIHKNQRKAGEGQGVTVSWEDTFEELDAAVNAFIRFLELKTKSQYVQETAAFTRTHNWNPINRRLIVCGRTLAAAFSLRFSTYGIHCARGKAITLGAGYPFLNKIPTAGPRG